MSKRTAPPLPRNPDAVQERQHVVLVGFMGAGKSTVGKLLAERGNMTFVDLDEVIARAAGKSIRDIFKELGEVAFRARERSALREVLGNKAPHVIATGGGTFADPLMRGWVQQAARSIYLEASPDVLLQRIGTGEERNHRPMLSGPDPEDTVRRLLNDRLPAYEESDFKVRTDTTKPDQVANEIIRLLRIEKPANGRAHAARGESAAHGREVNGRARVPLAPRLAPDPTVVQVRARAGDYNVLLHEAAGTWLAREIAAVCPGARIAIISDEIVAQFHLAALVRDLGDAGKKVSTHLVPPGEVSKSLNTAGQLYDALLEAGLDRHDAIVALGGGVVGDLAGFVAATLMRGIRYVQVPTTTLASVDASIGGKTGVNTTRGKNLVGAFHPPRAVLIAAEHLATQDKREHAAGLAEVVKMAACLDAELFTRLVAAAGDVLAFSPIPLLAAIHAGVRMKAEVVSRDEREEGERLVLNFGHTIGHAIETGEGYRLLHGEAVALGMIAEVEWAELEGLSSHLLGPLTAALKAFRLPVDWRERQIDLEALGADKKRAGASVRLPCIRSLGTFEIHSVPVTALSEFVRHGRTR